MEITGHRLALQQSGEYRTPTSPTQKTSVFSAISGLIRKAPEEGELEVIVRLDKTTASKLRAASARTGVGVSRMVTDMVENCAKYMPEE